MRTQLYEELTTQFEIVFYHQAEYLRLKECAHYSRDAIKRRIKKISHFVETAELFGVITRDEERSINEYLDDIKTVSLKFECLVLVPDLNFLIGKDSQTLEHVSTWHECLSLLTMRGAISDMTFESLSKLMRAYNLHNWNEEIPFPVEWN